MFLLFVYCLLRFITKRFDSFFPVWMHVSFFISFTQGTVFKFQLSMTNSWYCHYWWFNRLFRYSQHLYSLPIPPRYLGPFDPHTIETDHVCMSEKPNVFRRHHHNLPSSPIIHPARSPADGRINAGIPTNQTFTVTRRRHIKIKKKTRYSYLLSRYHIRI